MQEIIKLKLIGLGYSKYNYDPDGLMDWLDKKNDIVFITNSKLINPDIFTEFIYNFLTPGITNYEDYLKIKEKYGGLPIALEKYDIEYLEWLEFINFYDFVKQHKIEILSPIYWCIYPWNYIAVKKINSKLKEKLIKKSIKTKKLKI